jgi:hypothetical protein
VVVLALVAGLAIFVQIQQRILRWRAERLLADVRELQSHESTRAEARKLLTRWDAWDDAWDSDNNSCARESCEYYIRLVDSFTTFIQRYVDHYPRLLLLIWPAELLGEKDTLIEVVFRIDKGIVEESRFRMYVGGRDEGMARAVNGFVVWDNFRVERLQHPEYYAEKYPGCTGCIRFETAFTPFAGRDKIRELTDFNFSCITRWSPCTTEADVMPSAWKLYQAELPDDEARWKAVRECKVPLESIGRENWIIVLADVLSRQGPKTPGDRTDTSARLRIMQVLKGKMPWPRNKTLTASNTGRGEEIFWNSNPDMLAGKRYILYGMHVISGENMDVLDLDECGVVPYNEQNLSAIQRGIDASLARRIPER